MRYLLLFAIFGLCAVVAPRPAQAVYFTGAYLLQICEKDDKGWEIEKGGHAACQAYILGVIDYHNVLSSLKIAPSVDICVPQDTSPADLHDIVLAYMRKHKENDAFVAAPIVTMALYEVFPCKKRKR